MYGGRDNEICELLAADGLVAARRLHEAREERRLTGTPVAQVAVNRGWVSRPRLVQAVAAHLGREHAAQVPATVPLEAVGLVPPELARRHRVVPLRREPAGVVVLPVDPFAPELPDDLAFALGRGIRLAVGDPAHVEALWRRHYGDGDSAAEPPGRGATAEPSADDLAALAVQVPVVRFVNLVLARAVRDRASDLHFEPFEDEYRVRCRIDGTLFDLPPPPRGLAPAIASRLKILANLDIAERRVPQDGRIRLGVAGRAVDLRVSTLPTQFGESIVLRVLDRSATGLELDDLGLPPGVVEVVRRTIRRPSGIFIVTGPTGSGKTTTLYSCLRRLNAVDTKVLTVEDPVEYEIEGVMQVPVNPVAGLSFASALRSFLRHDPDVVMVGEIRDLETAQIAIQAALTGHLVLATLHTNDAAGAITRLTDMGVERFLLASTIEAVLAQRLVRRICPDCRERCAPDPAQLERLGLAPGSVPQGFRGRGCARCRESGYRGRLGIFEIFAVDDELRELIARGAPLEALRDAARARGLRPLREDGWRLVREGGTTAEELARYV